MKMLIFKPQRKNPSFAMIIWKLPYRRLRIVTGYRWEWSKSFCSNAVGPKSIAARHTYSGRKPIIVQTHENQMRIFLTASPI